MNIETRGMVMAESAKNDKPFDIVATLAKKYAIFSSDATYYQNVVDMFSTETPAKAYQQADATILLDIRRSIKTDNAWFIDYIDSTLKKRKAMLSLLNQIANLCTKWFIDIDLDALSDILGKSTRLEGVLKEIISGVKPVTITKLERVSANRVLTELLISYATIKDLIEEEKNNEKSDEDDFSYDEDNRRNSKDSVFSSDSIKMYLREISVFPLLTPEEEKVWGTLAKEGDDEAKKILAQHNLRLVVDIAKRFMGRGLEFADLIQAGNEGLLRGVEKFDPDKGYKFSTYATWWVRQKIDRTIKDEARTIRIPVHLHDTYRKIIKTRENLTNQYGTSVTWEEVAQEIGMSVEDVMDIVIEFYEAVSINAKVGEDADGNELGDFLSNPDADTPEDVSMRGALAADIASVLSTLTDREEKIIRMRFAIQDLENPKKEYSRVHTLEEVGAYFDVTRERIRQIEAKALRKLRHPNRARKLAAYSGNGVAVKNGGSVADTMREEKKTKAQKQKIKSATEYASNNQRELAPIVIIKPGDPDWTPPRKIKDYSKYSPFVKDKQPSKPDAAKTNVGASVSTTNSKTIIPEEDDEMKKSYMEEKFLYEVLECKPEEFKILKPFIISQKEYDSYSVLFTIHGEDLQAAGSLANSNITDKKNYYNGVNVLTARIKRIRELGIKSLQEKLGATDEEYPIVLPVMKGMANYELLEKVHGKDLLGYANEGILTRKEEHLYNKLISDGKSFLISYRNNKFLKDRITCSEGLWPSFIRFVLSKNGDDFDLLKRIYGDNLEQKEDFSKVSLKEKNRCLRIVSSLNELANDATIASNRTLLNFLDWPEEKIDELEAVLKEDAELKKVVDALYPNSYTQATDVIAYLNLGKKEFLNVIKKLADYLAAKKAPKATIFTALGLEESDLDIVEALKVAVELTTPEYYKRLVSAYGDDLLGERKPSRFDISPVITKLKPRVQIAKKFKGKTFYETHNMSFGEIARFRDRVSKAKFLPTIEAMYGKDISGVFSLVEYFKLDGRAYYGCTVGLENLLGSLDDSKDSLDDLISEYEGNTLEDNLGLSTDEILPLLEQVKHDDLICLVAVHGSNNEKAFSIHNPKITATILLQYNKVLEELKNLYRDKAKATNPPKDEPPAIGPEVKVDLVVDNAASGRASIPASSPQKEEVRVVPPVDIPTGEPSGDIVHGVMSIEPSEPELLVPGNPSAKLCEYTHPLFKEAINVVPINYRYILALHLGLQPDGICYPVETLMEIFNRSKEEIEETLQRGKVFFDGIVAAYESVYARSFPNEEPGEARKLIM